MNDREPPVLPDPFAMAEIIHAQERDIPFAIVMTSKDPVHGSAVLQTAQEHITQKYLAEKFITPEDVDEDGIYRDEYTDRSVYLLAENSRRDSASRYITATKKEGLSSLPTARHFVIDPVVIKETAGVKQLSDIKYSDVIEISGLVSTSHATSREEILNELDATRLMYARILRESLDQGHKLWLFNTDDQLVRYLSSILGKDQVHRLGESMYYKGSDTIPVALNPQKTVEAILSDTTSKGIENSRYVQEALQGVSDRHLSKELRALLKARGIHYEKSTVAERLRRKLLTKEMVGRAVIFTWVIGRAVPVANEEPVPGLFFGLDFVTAFPYTWGLVEMVSGKTPTRRVIGGSVAAASFAIPYAYLYGFGEDYPEWFAPVIAGFVGVGGLTAAMKIRGEKRAEKKLRDAVPEKPMPSSDAH